MVVIEDRARDVAHPKGCGTRGQWCRTWAHCPENRAVNPARNMRGSRAVSPNP